MEPKVEDFQVAGLMLDGCGRFNSRWNFDHWLRRDLARDFQGRGWSPVRPQVALATAVRRRWDGLRRLGWLLWLVLFRMGHSAPACDPQTVRLADDSVARRAAERLRDLRHAHALADHTAQALDRFIRPSEALGGENDLAGFRVNDDAELRVRAALLAKIEPTRGKNGRHRPDHSRRAMFRDRHFRIPADRDSCSIFALARNEVGNERVHHAAAPSNFPASKPNAAQPGRDSRENMSSLRACGMIRSISA